MVAKQTGIEETIPSRASSSEQDDLIVLGSIKHTEEFFKLAMACESARQTVLMLMQKRSQLDRDLASAQRACRLAQHALNNYLADAAGMETEDESR